MHSQEGVSQRGKVAYSSPQHSGVGGAESCTDASWLLWPGGITITDCIFLEGFTLSGKLTGPHDSGGCLYLVFLDSQREEPQREKDPGDV